MPPPLRLHCIPADPWRPAGKWTLHLQTLGQLDACLVARQSLQLAGAQLCPCCCHRWFTGPHKAQRQPPPLPLRCMAKLDWAQDLSAASGKPVGCLCELPSQAASSAKQPKWAHRPHGGSTAAALALHAFNRI